MNLPTENTTYSSYLFHTWLQVVKKSEHGIYFRLGLYTIVH